jgi:hypothetical protein
MLTYATQAGHLEFAENSPGVRGELAGKSGDFVTITCRRFAEYADNYHKYGAQLQSDFKDSSKQEVEEEVEEEKKKKEKKKKRVQFIAPEVGEVIAYFAEKGFPEALARRAHEHYAVADWHDAEGKPVRSWKQKMLTVWMKEENRNGQNNRSSGSGRGKERLTITDDILEQSVVVPPGGAGRG